MAKLVLKFEGQVLKEIPLKKSSFSIGRTPGNDVVIDNLAVSGHHARLSVDQDHYIIEDMNSLNGTFLNNQRIRRSTLKEGDEIMIGKHTLVYREDGGGAAPSVGFKSSEPAVQSQPGMDVTMVLDTKKRREFLAQATSMATGEISTEAGAAKDRLGSLGSLVVLAGKTDQREYILTSKLIVIGKSQLASVRLKGWFAPKSAAVIHHREGRYEIAPSDKAGVARVNSDLLKAARELREGDIIQIGRVRMQFNFRE
jgi:predicted component of type VI protein secretion system